MDEDKARDAIVNMCDEAIAAGEPITVTSRSGDKQMGDPAVLKALLADEWRDRRLAAAGWKVVKDREDQ